MLKIHPNGDMLLFNTYDIIFNEKLFGCAVFTNHYQKSSMTDQSLLWATEKDSLCHFPSLPFTINVDAKTPIKNKMYPSQWYVVLSNISVAWLTVQLYFNWSKRSLKQDVQCLQFHAFLESDQCPNRRLNNARVIRIKFHM